MNKIIDERIAILEEKAKQEAEAVQQEEPEPAKAVKQESAESESSETSEFEIKVSVTAVESDAKDVLSLIEKTVASDERVTSVTLTKA